MPSARGGMPPRCAIWDLLRTAQTRYAYRNRGVPVTVMIGDMNLVAAGEGRLQLRTGSVRPGRDNGTACLEESFPDYAEIIADGYSRRQYRDGDLDVVSRIDRVQSNAHTSDLLSLRSSARYMTPIGDLGLPSDHSALEIRLSPPSANDPEVGD